MKDDLVIGTNGGRGEGAGLAYRVADMVLPPFRLRSFGRDGALEGADFMPVMGYTLEFGICFMEK